MKKANEHDQLSLSDVSLDFFFHKLYFKMCELHLVMLSGSLLLHQRSLDYDSYTAYNIGPMATNYCCAPGLIDCAQGLKYLDTPMLPKMVTY